MDTRRLEKLLEAEASSYDAFVTRLPLKLALIKKGQVGPLAQFLAREEEAQRALRILERERIALSCSLNASLGLPKDASLAQALPLMPDREAAVRLEALAKRLVTVAKRLKEGHERCRILLEASLDFVRFSMEVYARLLNPQERLADMLYGPAATGAQVTGISLLNRSA